MRVLVACEESQAVCMEMRRIGHEAYSCDIIPCSGGHPEWHIQCDARELLKMRWDMIIAHPPCTYLSKAGAVNLFDREGNVKDEGRMENGWKAREFFMEFLNAECERVCVENPVPLKIYGLPKYSQIIEPYMFGEPWKKKTCLWLKGLPPLFATEIVEPMGLWVGSTSQRRAGKTYSRYRLRGKRSQRERSKTFKGIARAMAEQWGRLDD